MYGPGLFNVDLSLIKHTRIKDKVDFEFRTEIFNLLNRDNLGLPNPAVFAGPTAGQIRAHAIIPAGRRQLD